MISWYFKAEIKVGELYTFTKTTFDSDWKFEPRAAYGDLSTLAPGSVLTDDVWNADVKEFYEMEVEIFDGDWSTDSAGIET